MLTDLEKTINENEKNHIFSHIIQKLIINSRKKYQASYIIIT